MPRTRRLTAVVLLGGLVSVGVPGLANGQPVPTFPIPAVQPVPLAYPVAAVGTVADVAPGSIDGTIRNDRGEPVSGVVVTAIGVKTSFAVTDDRGHFEIGALSPGSYLLRAHSTGYVSPKPRRVKVQSNLRAVCSLAIRRATILAAGMVGGAMSQPAADPPSEPENSEIAADTADDGGAWSDDHSETGWRLKHLRRGVLRESELAGDWFSDVDDDETHAVAMLLGRAVRSPARAATSFFADTPLSGQVNLLTTNTFGSPEESLAGMTAARGIAYLKVGAPVGDQADWTVRAALTDGDLSSWIVAGAYQTRGSARRARHIGMSYTTQRYGGGNPLALREVSEGTRNAGSMYAFETFTLNGAVTIAYGARYERFDYLDDRNLLSPRAELTLKPFSATRFAVAVSSRADAPGAQEFRPPSEEGIWLPPQRTFSSARPGRPLRAERTVQVSASMERDWGPTTVAVRAFRQQVADQTVTIFGADAPEFPGAKLGHYVVGTGGDVDASGGVIALRADLGSRFRGSVAYTNATALLTPGSDLGYIVVLSPSVNRRQRERLQDVTTTVEAEVPETATRLLVLYRIGNGYARQGTGAESRVDTRYDVQIRQALPFLNFTSAKWEMLVAVRNSFREVNGEQSVYDELLTVQAPKRIIGGLTLHF